MLAFFESDECISKRLAEYFGEQIEAALCGHCSWCKGGKAVLAPAPALQPIGSFDFKELSAEFIQVIGDDYSVLNLVKFLCGIYTPIFARLRIKQLPHFGALENYPFGEVKELLEVVDHF